MQMITPLDFISSNNIYSILVRILECHFCAIASMFTLFVFLNTNKFFDKPIRRLFYMAIICVLCLVFADSIVMIFNTASQPCFLQVICRALGYAIRPLIAFLTLLVVMRGYQFANKNKLIFFRVCTWLPAIINILISLSALFCGLQFSYSSTNELVRGPLAFSSHIVAVIYEIGIITSTLRFFKEKNYLEGVLLLNLLIILSLALVLDIFVATRLTIGAAAMCVVFYYMYFHVQSQKRDQLTNAYNRRTFFMDANKYKKDICGLVGVDLNDLKILNDTQGHSVGDKALLTLSNVINELLPSRCRLYRTGGDEFVVLCRRVSENEIVDFIKKVKNQMETTDYRCALGMAYSTGKENIDQLYKIADQKMYEDKIEMKAGRNYREKNR